MIKRQLEELILSNQKKGFINLIYGPRRVGKTVLLKKLTENVIPEKLLYLNGDTDEARRALSDTSDVNLTKLVQNIDVVAVDEAQRINNIGLSLKILIDKFPEKTFYVTGSSSLMLSRGLKEPLTGRSQKYKLYPLSTSELTRDINNFQRNSILESQLVYGGYPYLLETNTSEQKRSYLKSIVDDYLFKDLDYLVDISVPENLKNLASLLAFQIGSQVSLNELSRSLGIDVKTVRKYINLLKQGFIIFELPSYSTNLRKELIKSKKYYFWDLGIRNALIDQFLSLNIRQDIGVLWENFLAIERIKKHGYVGIEKSYYFWRNYEKAEVDWIEIENNMINAYEFKWNKKGHTPKGFLDIYKKTVETISKDNYIDFVV